jgi:hypothetical protein
VTKSEVEKVLNKHYADDFHLEISKNSVMIMDESLKLDESLKPRPTKEEVIDNYKKHIAPKYKTRPNGLIAVLTKTTHSPKVFTYGVQFHKNPKVGDFEMDGKAKIEVVEILDKGLKESLTKHLDFASKEKKANTMTVSQLEYAIKDCIDCVRKGIDQDYYQDEASVYRTELNKRNKNKSLKEDYTPKQLKQTAMGLRHVGYGHYKNAQGKSFDWDENASDFITKDVSKEIHGHVGREVGNQGERKNRTIKDIVDVSKNHPQQLYQVRFDKDIKGGSSETKRFYLKNGKFAKKTSANPNYDFANNIVSSPRDSEMTEYYFSPIQS